MTFSLPFLFSRAPPHSASTFLPGSEKRYLDKYSLDLPEFARDRSLNRRPEPEMTNPVSGLAWSL